MADLIGKQMGNYRLIRLLGSGGFAEVYLGEHIHLNTQAAIKVLHTQLTDKELDKFYSEARTLSHLEHPHIVRVLDFGVDGNIPYLIMNYAPNGSLRQHHPQGKPLLLSTIVFYVKQIADALQYIHDKKLIHRDIKPHNILLGPNNEVLVSDFGLALVALSSRNQSALDIAGTITYMAPEQLQGKPRRASDQYALGVIVYEWLCGELPFQGAFGEIASQHMLTSPPSLCNKVPELPADVEKVVMTALAKEPQQRFASIRAFANALEQAYQPLLPLTPINLKSEIISPLKTNVLVDELSQPESVPGIQIEEADPQLLSLVIDDLTEPSSQPLLPLHIDMLPTNKLIVSTDQPYQLPKEDTPFGQGSRPVQPSLTYHPIAPLMEENANLTPVLERPQTMVFTRMRKVQTERRRNTSSAMTPAPIPMLQQKTGGKRGKRSLMFLISAIMIVILLVIGALTYYGYQTVTTSTVTINFGPTVVALNEIYPLTATVSAQSVDITNSIIPVHVFTANQTLLQSGPTTGQVNCTFNILGCQQGVAQSDIDTLVRQMQPDLERQIAQQLLQQIVGTGGIQVTNTRYTIVSVIPTPAIGQPGTTVKVEMVEQGSVGYVLSGDTTSVARNALMKQVTKLGANYMLLSNTVEIGRPVIQSINTASGQVTLEIAASGDAIYQFPDVQLQSIRENLRGKTVSDAQHFLASQPGIDPQTIAIHIRQGSSNSLPDNIQSITIVPLNVSTYPPVYLKSVPSPSSNTTTPTSSSPTATATSSPTP